MLCFVCCLRTEIIDEINLQVLAMQGLATFALAQIEQHWTGGLMCEKGASVPNARKQ